jgi:hypothetical protein
MVNYSGPVVFSGEHVASALARLGEDATAERIEQVRARVNDDSVAANDCDAAVAKLVLAEAYPEQHAHHVGFALISALARMSSAETDQDGVYSAMHKRVEDSHRGVPEPERVAAVGRDVLRKFDFAADSGGTKIAALLDAARSGTLTSVFVDDLAGELRRQVAKDAIRTYQESASTEEFGYLCSVNPEGLSADELGRETESAREAMLTALAGLSDEDALDVLRQTPNRDHDGSAYTSATLEDIHGWRKQQEAAPGASKSRATTETDDCGTTAAVTDSRSVDVRVANPDFDAVRDKRMSELTPAQRDDAMELWLREQVGTMPDYHEKHYRFLLQRLDDVRAVAKAQLGQLPVASLAQVESLEP